MPINVTCDCGRSLRVKDECAGHKVRCPECKNPVPVPAFADQGDDDAVNLLLDDSTPTPALPRQFEIPRPAARVSPLPLNRPASSPQPSKPMNLAQLTRPVPPKPPRRKQRERTKTSFAVNPSIVSGILMMLGAVVWFVAGLAAGYIFFYPPILFVLGIGAIIKGFRGED
ncbi:MAG: hypothetical protein ACJ8C4_08290 [Gemmataceae bacterium]